ncbi:MAG: hypothetical protein L0099_12855, partial [Acidobacteria bacterium]|nr:hypothetical protein [Acidobacteriota bacterium]
FEIERELKQNAPLVAALINGDAKDFDARIKHLSPTAREALLTARTLLVELGHELVDHITPYDLGNIVGQVLYEVVEDAAISAALAAATAATAGTASPAVGAAIAQKGLKIARIVHRLEKRFGDAPRMAKALKKAEQLVFYMINYAICFVAGTPVHTAQVLRGAVSLVRVKWAIESRGLGGDEVELEKRASFRQNMRNCVVPAIPQERTPMKYGTWLMAWVASTVAGVDGELTRQLAPLWQRITQLVVSFFGPRGVTGGGPGLRA